MKSRLSGAVCACTITLVSVAPALSAPVFPDEIQACVADGVCTDPDLQFDSPDMVVYEYIEDGAQKALIGYELQNGSKQKNADGSSETYGGPIWISANQSYDLSEDRHFFSLYLDQVIPQPGNFWGGDSNMLDVGLSMTTPDLLAGSSYFHLFDDQGFILEGDLQTHGDQGGSGLIPCLSDTCEVGAEFNLINLAYVVNGSQASLNVDLSDTRNLLYSQFIGYAGERDSQYYYVKPIPLPPALFLFGTGLVGLVGMVRRKAA
jgi:hypothetical protein